MNGAINSIRSSAVFMLIVTGVGFAIFVFATGYMHSDPGFYRFFAYMGLFMFSMLVLGDGIELRDDVRRLGRRRPLLLNLLIGYYFNRAEAANASRRPFYHDRHRRLWFYAGGLCDHRKRSAPRNYQRDFRKRWLSGRSAGHWGLLSWNRFGVDDWRLRQVGAVSFARLAAGRYGGGPLGSALIHAATDGHRRTVTC